MPTNAAAPKLRLVSLLPSEGTSHTNKEDNKKQRRAASDCFFFPFSSQRARTVCTLSTRTHTHTQQDGSTMVECASENFPRKAVDRVLPRLVATAGSPPLDILIGHSGSAQKREKVSRSDVLQASGREGLAIHTSLPRGTAGRRADGTWECSQCRGLKKNGRNNAKALPPFETYNNAQHP